MKIQRDSYLKKLIDRKHNGMIKIISGIRRCGKSYLLSEIFTTHLQETGVDKKHIIHISLDTRDDEKYRNPDTCNSYVKSLIKDNKPYYLLLDEIQMMDDFESVLNGFLRIKNLDVYVTGSNSKFLSTDIVTEFRGRGDEIKIYPFSFAEIYSFFYNDWNMAWGQYSVFGGMPLVLNYKEQTDKIKYLQNLFIETYLKDIIDRNKIKNTEELEELIKIIASNIGSLTNPAKLENSFKSVKRVDLTAATIKQYMNYLQDAFFINKVLRYDVKGKKYINTPFKCYFTDIGLRNACLDFRQLEQTHIMENIIYNDLARRGFNVDVGVVEYFPSADGKTTRVQLEVDFVINRGNLRYDIQSAFAINSEEKKEQERNSLKRIDDSFKKIIIVRENIVPRYDEYGIYYIGIRDFLLMDDFLEA